MRTCRERSENSELAVTLKSRSIALTAPLVCKHSTAADGERPSYGEYVPQILSQPGVKDEPPKAEFLKVKSPKAEQPRPKQECLKLLEAIFDCLEDSDENRLLKKSPKLQLLLYFDEAHTLTDGQSNGIVHNPDSWSAYEVLLSALNSFACPQVFSLFLSTNPHMSVLAPTPGQPYQETRTMDTDDERRASPNSPDRPPGGTRRHGAKTPRKVRRVFDGQEGLPQPVEPTSSSRALDEYGFDVRFLCLFWLGLLIAYRTFAFALALAFGTSLLEQRSCPIILTHPSLNFPSIATVTCPSTLRSLPISKSH